MVTHVLVYVIEGFQIYRLQINGSQMYFTEGLKLQELGRGIR